MSMLSACKDFSDCSSCFRMPSGERFLSLVKGFALEATVYVRVEIPNSSIRRREPGARRRKRRACQARREGSAEVESGGYHEAGIWSFSNATLGSGYPLTCFLISSDHRHKLRLNL